MFNKLVAHFTNKNAGLQRMTAWILVVGAAVGLFSCTAQAIERVEMLKNPGAPLPCNINQVVACGNVLSHPLASVMGFPNAFIGMVVFAGLLLGGLALLAGGDKLKKWFWYTVYSLVLVLLGFVVWFFAVSLYVIGNICVYCIACWGVGIPVFIFTTAWLNSKDWLRLGKLGDWLKKQSNASLWGITAAIYVIMLLLVFIRFKDAFLHG